MLPNFVLASASIARRRLLESVGIKPIIRPSDFDESQLAHPETSVLVESLALAKAQTVALHYQNSLILGCDSLLLVAGQAYGKPDSVQTAIARWQLMRGKIGLLYTGHALIDQVQNRVLQRCGITKVSFADIDNQTIAAYVKSGEPLQCAGAFALEGKGGLLIEKLEGCHSNVIGLSLPLLRQMLTDLGYKVADFWELG
ncbi:MAG: Maf family protein [Microcystaceae cyanobacterium]